MKLFSFARTFIINSLFILLLITFDRNKIFEYYLNH
jgi:hypothetical protein